MIHRVLVVDDHEAWRRYICEEIQKNSRWRVIGEAPDGLQAARQAQLHKPDLILLDISLPMLNGLEAARRILANDPTTRILFLTEQSHPEIVEAALDLGARGYMVKTVAGGHLLSAMETIVNGGRFLSAGLEDEIIQTARERMTRHHEARFYPDETPLLDDYVRLAEAALGAGNAFILLSGESRRHHVRERLEARGIVVDRAVGEGRYLAFDPGPVLSEFMVDGRLDAAKFRAAAAALVGFAARSSTRENRRVVACGECCPCLWSAGNAEAAIWLEQLWDEVAKTGVDIFCAYSLDVRVLADDAYAVFQRICAEHSDVRIL